MARTSSTNIPSIFEQWSNSDLKGGFAGSLPQKSRTGTVSGVAGTVVNDTSLVGTGTANTGGATNVSPTTPVAGNTSTDFRIRVGFLQTSGKNYSGILEPLAKTKGLMFPYSPSITWRQDVDYDSMTMVHSNTNYMSYTRTPNPAIQIQGKFTVQNNAEGLYMLAAIHFLRAVSKMHFGENDSNAGTPPPMLELNGYGTYMFNRLRGFIKSHSYNFNDSDQTVEIETGSGYVRLPVILNVSLEFQLQTTPRAQRKDFKLDEFTSGALMAAAPNNNGWI